MPESAPKTRAIYDIRGGRPRNDRDHPRLVTWANTQGIDLKHTIRMEIHATDGGLVARLTDCALDDNGVRIVEGDYFKLLEPRDVPVTSAPDVDPFGG